MLEARQHEFVDQVRRRVLSIALRLQKTSLKWARKRPAAC